MSWFIFIICLIMSIIVTFRVSNDLLYPGVMFCIPWLTFGIFLPITKFNVDLNNSIYIYLALGTIMFEVGCICGYKRIVKNERLKEKKFSLDVNKSFLNCIIFIEILFTIFTIFQYYIFLKNNYNINIYQTFALNIENLAYNGIISYARNIILAISICLIIAYSYMNQENRLILKKQIIIQILLTIIIACTRTSRNGILFMLLPLLIVYIVITKQKNKKLMKKLIISFLLFMIFFCAFSSFKYFYKFSNGNYKEEFKNQILGYGCGGIIALQNLPTDLVGTAQGRNTFRFFIAFYDAIMGTKNSSELVQKYTNIGGDSITNVYTFYQYYITDFGYIYALFIQFLIGVFNGILYKKMSQQRPFWIYLFCIFEYPLLMEFFQDQYISLLSTWIQMVIVGLIFLKTNFLFNTVDDNK